MALSSKARDGKLIIMDTLSIENGKTKVLASNFANIDSKRALVIDGDVVDVSFARAASNLHMIDVLPAVGANVYDILRADTLVLTRAAVEKLEARFNG